jgi:hypothetical protein
MLKLKKFPTTILCLAAICMTALSSCQSAPQEPPLTQLEIREMQTRSFETIAMKDIMKSMINVLQDEGFIIEHADKELGLVRGEKNQDIENSSTRNLNTFLYGEHARWDKVKTIKASGNITEHGELMKVRIIFEMTQIDNKGAIQAIQAIKDGNYYQDFFSKLDKSIFITKSKI